MSRYGRLKLIDAMSELRWLFEQELAIHHTSIEVQNIKAAQKAVKAYAIQGIEPGAVLYV